jgi:Rrf2 family protein
MLSLTSQYGIRALIVLARRSGDAAMLVRDIAEEADIPPPYLFKVLRPLARAGIVSATRGSGGGYRLARPASEIRLVHVVEAIDPARVEPACIIGAHAECSDLRPCSAHARWRKARAAYVRFLERTSIDEIGTAVGPIALGARGSRR